MADRNTDESVAATLAHIRALLGSDTSQRNADGKDKADTTQDAV